MRRTAAIVLGLAVLLGGLAACHRAVPPNVSPPDVDSAKAGDAAPAPPPAPRKD